MTRVNALALTNGDAEYVAFIDHVNVVIDQAYATLAARQTHAAGKKEMGE